jgi:hypothetical protein
VEHFKFLGTTPTDQNPIHEEIKGSLKTGNACYHSVQNLPSSSLLFKNIKLMYTELSFFLLFCIGVKRGRSHLREELRLRLFENRALRRIFGPKRDEVTGV